MSLAAVLKCGKIYKGKLKFLSHVQVLSMILQRPQAINFIWRSIHCDARSYTVSAVKRVAPSSTQDPTHTDEISHSQWVNFVPFPKMLEMRREEAQRSMVVEVQSQSICAQLESYCSTLGPVKHFFFYTNNARHYVLVEFCNGESLKQALQTGQHTNAVKIVPVTSPYTWFNTITTTESRCKSVLTKDVTESTTFDQAKFEKGLHSKEKLADQMQFLYESFKISDISTRLRFLTCNQLERALSGLFPDCRALPFGSSVSGFGRNSGDLDIYLEFKAKKKAQNNGTNRLIFQSKSWRNDTNLQLKLVGDLISVMLPGCVNVRSIMGARVPIIKYHQNITNMECDVQNSSASGIDMTHLLWIMCHWDERVAPLVYTLRHWAKVNKITTDSPSPNITNFSLVIMLIYFLQQEQVLPTLCFLGKAADPISCVSYDSSIQLNFLQDIRLLPKSLWVTTNQSSVDELLLKFFEYYDEFPFESKALCIFDGGNYKPDSRFLWIVNPLNPSLNISRNVSKESVTRFRRLVKESLQMLREKKSLVNILPISMNKSLTEFILGINVGETRLKNKRSRKINVETSRKGSNQSKGNRC